MLIGLYYEYEDGAGVTTVIIIMSVSNKKSPIIVICKCRAAFYISKFDDYLNCFVLLRYYTAFIADRQCQGDVSEDDIDRDMSETIGVHHIMMSSGYEVVREGKLPSVQLNRAKHEHFTAPLNRMGRLYHHR